MADNTHNPFPILDDAFASYGRVRGGGHMTTIDDAYVDRDISAGGPGSYIGHAVDDIKRIAFFSVLGLMLLTVVGRAALLQLAGHAAYAEQAEGNRSRIIAVPMDRGIMYDRSGIPLVRNVPTFTATIIPADLPDDTATREATLDRIAGILTTSRSAIEDAFKPFEKYPTSPVTVGENLTHDQAVRLRIEESLTPGVALVIASRREYLGLEGAPSLSHVLGYEGRITQDDIDGMAKGAYAPSDLIGKTGLEKQYEAALRGEVGKKRVEVDALGSAKKVIADTPGVPGKSLVLSIDYAIQTAAENALRDSLKRIGKTRGSVVVSDPRTGEILALVSVPDFDANHFAAGISSEEYAALSSDRDRPMFPRAIAASLPSGSVFKPVVAAAALEEHIVTPTTAFLSVGGLRIGQWFFPDWKAGGHGTTDLYKALAESVNTYFYIVGGGIDGREGLGVERIGEYARKFGFGARTGIDLPNEGEGFVPTTEWKERTKNEVWYIGDTYHFAIGQGDLLVTPLQVNAMTMIVANGGRQVTPHLVNAMTTQDGQREPVETVVQNEQVVSSESIEAVRKGMRQAVTLGSARSLGDLPVEAAAKTGTAQWSSTKPTHAWFTSFAPFDAPEIAVTVMLEEGGEGSSTAAPVAKAIYRAWLEKR